MPKDQKKCIRIRAAQEHNLKNIDLDIPRDELIVVTGVSGSGKSSLAFDTIFAEGQRKYMESLSSYARQFLQQMQKPQVEAIEGLPPTIAIEQRSAAHNPRSTVATSTEIYDYLRLLFARCGKPLCWEWVEEKGASCMQPIQKQSASQIIKTLLKLEGKMTLLAPLVIEKKGYHRSLICALAKEGFTRLIVNEREVFIDELNLEEENPLQIKRYESHNISAVVARTKHSQTKILRDSVETGLRLGKGQLLVRLEDGKELSFSEDLACPLHPHCSIDELQPRLFSFNSPIGACKSCSGLGQIQEFEEEKIVDEALSLKEGAFIALAKLGYFYFRRYRTLIRKVCQKLKIAHDQPFSSLDQEQKQFLLYGSGPLSEKSKFSGFVHLMRQRYIESENENLRKNLSELLKAVPCPACKGSRLNPKASHVFIQEKNIQEICQMSVKDSLKFFKTLKLEKEQKKIASSILKEIVSRLYFLSSVGLDYLSLSRKTASLSGGEAQRIRLASQVGTGLVGVCYVLDEPSIGLHARDNDKLIETLKTLSRIGNTVIVVEHDQEMIRAAEHIIDIGPGPGVHGGEIIAQGNLPSILGSPESLTAKFLNGEESVTRLQYRALSEEFCIKLKNATKNNLKNINLAIPLGGLVCVTGVSGSGKSTLVNEVLLKELLRGLKGQPTSIEGIEQISRVIAVDQSPIGKTPRSNPATYTGLFDEIRKLFSLSKEACVRGYGPGRFSFNVKGGRCESCEGQGSKKIEMHFLADVYVDCETCNGLRYNQETLQVCFREKNIAEVLQLTVEDACQFFEAQPKILRYLKTLRDVGLGYIQLGQASTTLSGGEAQRVKLAAELSRANRSSEHNLYILDEPTTGLHFADIKKLVEVFERLIEKGNSLIVIEHNLDVIRCADWIIDLGPEGGDLGGYVLASAPPQELSSKTKKSYTAKFLKKEQLKTAKSC